MPREPDDINLFRVRASKNAQYLIAAAKKKALLTEEVAVREGVDTYNKIVDMGQYGVVRIKRTDTGNGTSINGIDCFTPEEAIEAGLREPLRPAEAPPEPIPTPFDSTKIDVLKVKEKLEIDPSGWGEVEYYAGMIAVHRENDEAQWEYQILLYKVDFSVEEAWVDLSKPDYICVDNGPMLETTDDDLVQIRDTVHDGHEFIIHRLERKVHATTPTEYIFHQIPQDTDFVSVHDPTPPLNNGCQADLVSSYFTFTEHRNTEFWYRDFSAWRDYASGWVIGMKAFSPGVYSDVDYPSFINSYPHFSGILLQRHCGKYTARFVGKRFDRDELVYGEMNFYMYDSDATMDMGNINHRPVWNGNLVGDGTGKDPYGNPPTDWYGFDTIQTYHRLWEGFSLQIEGGFPVDVHGFFEFDMLPIDGGTDPLTGQPIVWPGGPLDKSTGNFWGRASFFCGNGQLWDFCTTWDHIIGPETGSGGETYQYENPPNMFGRAQKSFAVGMGSYYDDAGNEQWGTTAMKFFEPDNAHGWDGEMEFWIVARDGYFMKWAWPSPDNQSDIQAERDVWVANVEVTTTELFNQAVGGGPFLTGEDQVEYEVNRTYKILKIDGMYVKFPKPNNVLDDSSEVKIPSPVRQSYYWEA